MFIAHSTRATHSRWQIENSINENEIFGESWLGWEQWRNNFASFKLNFLSNSQLQESNITSWDGGEHSHLIFKFSSSIHFTLLEVKVSEDEEWIWKCENVDVFIKSNFVEPGKLFALVSSSVTPAKCPTLQRWTFANLSFPCIAKWKPLEIQKCSTSDLFGSTAHRVTVTCFILRDLSIFSLLSLYLSFRFRKNVKISHSIPSERRDGGGTLIIRFIMLLFNFIFYLNEWMETSTVEASRHANDDDSRRQCV